MMKKSKPTKERTWPKEHEMYSLKTGQEFVYHKGTTPRSYEKGQDFFLAMHLFLQGKILLFQRLVKRTEHFELKDRVGTFEYIAVGK